MTLAGHLLHQLQRSLKTCRKERERCLQADSADAVHDLRVACRRVLETLRVFEAVLRREQVAPLRDALRAWMRLSGEVRDLDIAIGLVQRSGIDGADALLRLLEARRDARAQRAAAQLALPLPWPRKRDLVRWLRPVKRGAPEALWDLELSPEANAALALPLLLERFTLRGDLLLAPGVPREAFHRFRLRTKRVRYATEWFADLFAETGAPALLATLKQFQQALGEVQDCAATAGLCERPALRKVLSVVEQRELHDFLDAEARAAKGRFLEDWGRFRASMSTAGAWRQTFPLPPAHAEPE